MRRVSAGLEPGDMWVDPGTGSVRVWTGASWTEAVNPTGEGTGTGRADRPDRPADPSRDADETRLGEHWAVRGADGSWRCGVCGGESMDAGVLAETGCGA